MGKLEELEKKIKDRWKTTATLLTQMSDEKMNEIIHDVYLESLESRLIDLQPPVYFLDPEANKKYAKKRTIVLSLLALIENNIDYLISVRLDKNFPLFPRPKNNSITQTISFLLNELRYQQKVGLLEILYNDEKIEVELLRDLGRIRDAFAHSLFMNNKKYEFEKRNVIQDLKALDDLVYRALELSKKLEAISEKQPEYLEFRKLIDKSLEENNQK